MPIAAAIVADNGVTAFAVLALREVAAERRSPAALDRRHHLQLVEAHMSCVGQAPSGTVVAEPQPPELDETRDRRYFADGVSLSRFFALLDSLNLSSGLSTDEIRPVATRA